MNNNQSLVQVELIPRIPMVANISSAGSWLWVLFKIKKFNSLLMFIILQKYINNNLQYITYIHV